MLCRAQLNMITVVNPYKVIIDTTFKLDTFLNLDNNSITEVLNMVKDLIKDKTGQIHFLKILLKLNIYNLYLKKNIYKNTTFTKNLKKYAK